MADRAALAHVLRRAAFGPTAAEVDAAERMGPATTLARLIRPTTADAGAAGTPMPRLAVDPYAHLTDRSDREARQRAQQELREQIGAATMWWLDRMVAAQHQLVEKMVFFWHGHWATSARKVRSAGLMLGQQRTFREHALGDTADLTRAMVRDPALIRWLDGQRNTRVAPNENLARELMELFTIGIGTYTETDVKEAARALTGWVVDRTTGTARLVARRHDDGDKTILGRTGPLDAQACADLLTAHPAHAPFLARRLWFRFASGQAMTPEVTERLAAAYRSGRDIGALLTALFTDPAYAGTRGQLVKQPVEWAVGAMRQLGVRPARLSEREGRQLLNCLDGLDQVPLLPPSVGGWPAGAAWLTTASLPVRMRLAEALAGWASATVDTLAAAPRAERVDAVARLLVVDGWTPRSRAVLADAAGAPARLLALALVTPEYVVH
jgi:uncharacterized protein (DUF1800 family)